MSPDKVSQRVVGDRLGWIGKMIDEIRSLSSLNGVNHEHCYV